MITRNKVKTSRTGTGGSRCTGERMNEHTTVGRREEEVGDGVRRPGTVIDRSGDGSNG